jgi:hypothetical protein
MVGYGHYKTETFRWTQAVSYLEIIREQREEKAIS